MDVATLSYAVDSKPLVDANRELDKLPAAAGRAEKAVDGLTKSTDNLGRSTETATKSTRNLGQYARTSSSGWGATAAAATTAANANQQMAGATAAAATAAVGAASAIKTTTVATVASAAASRMAANDNQKLALSATAVGAAYKFAAAIIIGVFAGAINSTTRAFVNQTESIKGAFETLGETWSATFDLGKQAATPLRNAIEDLTIAIENPAFTGFVQLIGRILFAALTLAVKGVTLLVEGINLLVNNIQAVAVAIGGPMLAALNLLDKTFKSVFGVGLYEIVKSSVNFIINSFVAAYEDVKLAWQRLPAALGDLMYGAANSVVGGVEAMVNGIAERIDKMIDKINGALDSLPEWARPGWAGPIGKIGPVKLGRIDNPFAGQADAYASERAKMLKDVFARDPVGDAGKYLTDGLGRRRITDTLPDKDKPGAGGAAAAADPYAKAIESAKEYLETKKAETAAIGQTAEAAARLKHETDLLNKAQGEGKALGKTQIENLQMLAGEMAKADAELKSATFLDDMRSKTQEFLAGQEAERNALTMSAEAANRARIEHELLTQAKQAGIDQMPGVVDAIKQEAAARAESQEKTRRYSEEVQLAKDVTSGFMRDINQGIREGTNVWEMFGNAAMNALTMISDKLMQMAVDELFEKAFPKGGSGSGGGGGGGLFDFLGSIFSSAAGSAGGAGGMSGSGWAYANGAAFRAGNVIPFAAGGLVNSPTMFPMSGGRSGLMGEAGPEAIMPLKRGPGGRLGVEAANSNRQPVIKLEVSGDTGIVRLIARDEAGNVIATAGPQIEASALKKANEQAPAAVSRYEQQRGGDYRTNR